MKNLYLQLLECQFSRQPMALATVTRTIGSTPQKAGSSALFDSKGLITGTVGGGIVEGKIHQIALQAISTGESAYYRFNLNKELLHGEDAICGGQIEILIDASPMDHLSAFRELKRGLEKRIPGVLMTTIKSILGNIIIERSWVMESTNLPFNHNGNLKKEIFKLISEKESGQYCEFRQSDPERTVFLEQILPPPQLIIAGAGHIGKALAHMASLLDFEVTVIDDRQEYANSQNIPEADHILVGEIGEVMSTISLNPDTYVVIVTRGHKDDAKALRECIGGEAAYVGMIGSRNKVAIMRDEFIRKGWAEPREWKDIHTPIGVEIHSKTVQEIAISIAAQLIQVKNAKVPVYV